VCSIEVIVKNLLRVWGIIGDSALYANGKDAYQERVITRNKPSRKREVMVRSEFLGNSVPEDPALDRFFWSTAVTRPDDIPLLLF
jgi:hypothetical protein